MRYSSHHRLQHSKAKYIALSLLITSTVVSIVILILTLGMPKFSFSINPFTGRSNKPKTISDFSNLVEVIDSQPKYTKKNTNFFIIESNSLDCEDCSVFHGEDKDNDSISQKLKKDFLDTGKYSYTWFDFELKTEITKNKSIYCFAEQKPDQLYEYINNLFKNSKQDYLTIGSNFNIDKKIFEECSKSNKYEDRVKKLTEISTSLGTDENTSTFYIIKIVSDKVKGLDGKSMNQKFPVVVSTINGNSEYEQIKKELENSLKR